MGGGAGIKILKFTIFFGGGGGAGTFPTIFLGGMPIWAAILGGISVLKVFFGVSVFKIRYFAMYFNVFINKM